jgi:hypothetical protein
MKATCSSSFSTTSRPRGSLRPSARCARRRQMDPHRLVASPAVEQAVSVKPGLLMKCVPVRMQIAAQVFAMAQ